MADKGKEGVKIKEFEWYEVETKVREIMMELLQPFNKKQTEDTIKINEIKRNMATVTKKMEDHEFLLEREGSKKPTYIELQDQRIADLEASTQAAQLENQRQITEMQNIVAIYEEKVKQLNELEKRLDKEVVQRGEEYRAHKESVDEQVALLSKRLEAQADEVAMFKNNTRAAVTKMETRMITFDNRLKELEDTGRHRNADIKRLFEDATNHTERITKLEVKSGDLTARIDDREKDGRLSEKFFTRVRELQNDMAFFTTFLEQYQPLYIQIHISEALHSFIEGNSRRRLCIYEEERYARLHHHILQNERISLEEMMSRYTNEIRKIINRNKKYVIDLQVKESVKYGTNLYEFREKPPEEDSQAPVVAQQKASLPEEEIAALLSQELTSIQSSFAEVVARETASTKQWIEEVQEQQMMRSIEDDKKAQELRGRIGSLEAQWELEEKHRKEQGEAAQVRQQQMEGEVGSFRECVRDILNFGSVINHIVIQDEIDRQSTALYALKSNKGQEIAQMPTLQLDPNCVSCDTKGSAMVQQAFKMACLTYNPSQIRID